MPGIGLGYTGSIASLVFPVIAPGKPRIARRVYPGSRHPCPADSWITQWASWPRPKLEIWQIVTALLLPAGLPPQSNNGGRSRCDADLQSSGPNAMDVSRNDAISK